MKIDQFQYRLAFLGGIQEHFLYLKGKCSPGQLLMLLCKMSSKQDKLLCTKSL